MWRYLLRRLLAAIPTIVGVVVLVFFAMRVLPGDITDKMVADFGLSAADITRLREQWGLDDPLHIQFGRFVSEMARGDLGRSIWSRRLVTEQIAEQVPATMELTVAATGIAVAIGAALLPLRFLADLTNIGTLFAFVIVCAAVLIMRRTNPQAPRPFRCPLVPLVPILGILSCLMLMLSLPASNWWRLIVWLGLGLVIYFAYSRKHSVMAGRTAA